jgi:hypothetical protein
MAEDNGLGPLARRTCLTIFQRYPLLSTFVMETVRVADSILDATIIYIRSCGIIPGEVIQYLQVGAMPWSLFPAAEYRMGHDLQIRRTITCPSITFPSRYSSGPRQYSK